MANTAEAAADAMQEVPGHVVDLEKAHAKLVR